MVVFKVRGMQRVKVRDMDGEKKSNVPTSQRRVDDTTATKAMTTMDTDDTPTCPAALLVEVSFPGLGVLEGAPPSRVRAIRGRLLLRRRRSTPA